MKTFKSLAILLSFSALLPITTLAQERAVNPGEDPNEARSSNSTESSVSAIGLCNECIARMYGANGKGSRLGDDTTYRPQGNGSKESSGGSQSTEGTR